MDMSNMDEKQLRQIIKSAADSLKTKTNPRPSRKLPKVLTPQQADKLLSVINTDTMTGKRQKAIIMSMLKCGLRVSEVCKLTRADIDFNRHTMYIQMAKGGKDRYVPMSSNVEGCIQDWLSVAPDSVYTFSTFKGKQASARNICEMVYSLSKRSGVYLQDGADKKLVHPHALRHTYATNLLNKGLNLEDIRVLLGHSYISTTQVYLSVSIHDLVDKVRGIN